MFSDSSAAITGLGDFINAIIKIRDPKDDDTAYFPWYRGHADLSWELIPKVHRRPYNSEEELFHKERQITNDFQMRASVFQMPKPKPNEYASWLTLMQHYGLPTRLLDWTRSPLVALFFAVYEESAWNKDACIWMLNPGKLNLSQNLDEQTLQNDKKNKSPYIYNMAHDTINTMIYTAFRHWDLSNHSDAITLSDKKFDYYFNVLKGKIAACYPIEADTRVYNQYSMFTVHNSLRKLTDVCGESTLKRLIIPGKNKKRLVSELAVCGITPSYVFPDFEHLARIIEDWYQT